MRHGKTFNHLGRTAPQRKALLSGMASSLILHKRIQTTLAKAKALRRFVEPLINRSKSDTTHNRRTVFAYLQSKESVKELFGPISEKVATRPGGYTRIVRLGNRHGDNAEMCLIELVDFNLVYQSNTSQTEEKATRRTRRGKAKSTDETDQIVLSSSTTNFAATQSENEAPVIVEQLPNATTVDEAENADIKETDANDTESDDSNQPKA